MTGAGDRTQNTIHSSDMGSRGWVNDFSKRSGLGSGMVESGADRTVVRKRATAPDRRGQRSVSAATFAGYEDRLVSPQWWLTGAGMAFAVMLLCLAAGNVVAPLPGSMLVAAILLCAAARYLARFESLGHPTKRRAFAFATGAVALPMALFAVGIAQWMQDGGLGWQWALAIMAGIGALGSLIQAGRQHMILLVQIPLWGALVLCERSVAGIAVLLLIVPAVALASRKQAERAQRMRSFLEAQIDGQCRAQDLLHELEYSGQYWFWETDRRDNIAYVSPRVAETLRRSPNELEGRSFSILFDMAHAEENDGLALASHLSTRSAFQDLSVRAAIPEQEEDRWWSISGRPIFDGYGSFVGFRGTGYDLTEKKRSQQEVSRLAQYDSLTGLANRHRMLGMLDTMLSAPMDGQGDCAIFLIDLDRFKQVNDSLGHPAGDALLKEVAQRLQHVVGDKGKVGRLGGDEFSVVLAMSGQDALAQLAHDIIARLSQPYSIESRRIGIGASIGIAIAPEHGETSAELIRNADLALYAAKRGGRGRYQFYAAALHLQALERYRLEQDLLRAIRDDGLELHYQPIIDTATDLVSGFEAMLRWQHPVKGLLSLNHFVNVTEDTNLVCAIGEWAVRTACRDLSAWPDRIRVALNIPPLLFANPRLPVIVANALVRAGVAASRLELEITENVFLDDDARANATFAALKRVGVRLALDNFGTGNSSLTYLKKIPFDKIKIDPGFVHGAAQPGSCNGAIAAAVAGLARSLGMDSTAQGVETEDELHLVRLYGCSHAQGGLFAGALPFAEASEWTRESAERNSALAERAARMARRTILRKVVLEGGGAMHVGTLRNISLTGALVQGMRNAVPGAEFHLRLSDTHAVRATCRWSEADLVGLEFVEPLQREDEEQLFAIPASVERGADAVRVQRVG